MARSLWCLCGMFRLKTTYLWPYTNPTMIFNLLLTYSLIFLTIFVTTKKVTQNIL